METITIENDISILYKEASSFPDGVLAAHQKLHALIPFSTNRKYFGISRPEKGVITYKAAAEEKYDGEAKELNCNTLILKKGTYVFSTVKDFMKDIESIGRAFNNLLMILGLDPEGYCVEWYFNDHDVKCMIRLNE